MGPGIRFGHLVDKNSQGVGIGAGTCGRVVRHLKLNGIQPRTLVLVGDGLPFFHCTVSQVPVVPDELTVPIY